MAGHYDMGLVPLRSDMHRHNLATTPQHTEENTYFKSSISVTASPKVASSPHCTVVASPVGLVHVLGFTPGEGEQGVPITANINFSSEVRSAVRVRLVVGRRAIATCIRELADETYGKWQLEGTVPPFENQQTASPKVLLTVQAVNLGDVVLDSVTFGEFTYWESEYGSQLRNGNKRRRDDDGAEDIKPSRPRYPPSPKLLGHSSPTPPPVPDSRRPRVQHQSRLYRRSNLNTVRGKGSHSALPDEYEHEAVLQILSPIRSLSQCWDATELHVGRRLVRFKKKQEGYKLKVTCEGIDQQDYHDGDIVVSCISRDEDDSYCITSVDIIYLLEKLVDDEFEVEEKNRIRRNLEGLRPTTVSKHKPGFEDFFQRIMDFPDPKPRNIEKDVKVFNWDLLPQALDKIISKYSIYCSPSEEVALLSSDAPNIICTASSPSSSTERNSNVDIVNQSILNPDEAQLASPHDESIAAAYVDPTVVDRYHVPQAGDVLFAPDTTSTIVNFYEGVITSNAVAPSFMSSDAASELSYPLEQGSRLSSGRDSVKVETPQDLVFFEVPQIQDSTDIYPIDGDGLHTYDSFEFQTLREHNLECSPSYHSV